MTGERIATLEEVKRAHFLATFAACGFSKQRTADALGVSLKTLYNALARYESAGYVARTPTGWRVTAPAADAGDAPTS